MNGFAKELKMVQYRGSTIPNEISHATRAILVKNKCEAESWILDCVSARKGDFMDLEAILNKEQAEAVRHTEGPLLVLAGAGSGKTRVLTHRIAYLIEEKGVFPSHILAITFTNKAAKEMQERVAKLLPLESGGVWVSTFHSMCLRILRREISLLGYGTDFSIYDTDDQRTLMRQILKDRKIDSKTLRERAVLSQISQTKNRGGNAEDYRKASEGDYISKLIYDCFTLYEEKMKKNNALDFDDLLLKTLELFQNFPEVLSRYQERFRYILVDEYQDTNDVQFRLIYALAKKYQNICVVGDDDQSIYRFRGANLENILSFESQFPSCHTVKLEQNYRSTAPILDLANAVIAENPRRKEKKLWTEKKEGKKVVFREYESGEEEAREVIKTIRGKGLLYKNFAILYRTNAQSRLFEEQCINWNIPYQIVGGVNFYQRKEIKDILAFMKLMVNTKDDVAFRRVINVPKRGIGDASLAKLEDYGVNLGGFSLMESLPFAKAAGLSGKALSEIHKFEEMVEGWKEEALDTLIERILKDTAYEADLQSEGAIEAESRMENIHELEGKLFSYIRENGEEASLSAFLEEVSLLSDLDRSDLTEDKITMMTLHGAKGLEFPVVFLVGLSDGLFPSSMSFGNEEEMEEERRLCYVGITRAEEELYLSSARKRMVNGQSQYFKISRFFEELSDELMEKNLLFTPKRSEEELFMEESGRSYYNSYLNNARSSILTYQGRSGGGFSGGNSYGEKRAGEKKNAFGSLDSLKQSGLLQKGFASVGKEKPDYKEGDRVSHMKFGEGTVLSLEEDKKDYLVTVLFDKAGQKKMMAGFAKLQKL